MAIPNLQRRVKELHLSVPLQVGMTKRDLLANNLHRFDFL